MSSFSELPSELNLGLLNNSTNSLMAADTLHAKGKQQQQQQHMALYTFGAAAVPASGSLRQHSLHNTNMQG
jgi:hypothetical protein